MKKRYFLYLFTWIPDLLMWPVILLFWLFWGTNLRWLQLGPWCDIKLTSWFYKKIYYGYGGTCLCHGGIFGGKPRAQTIFHETRVHVEQFEQAMVMVNIIAGVMSAAAVIDSWRGALIAGVILIAFGWLIYCASGWIVAWLRGEDPYRGATHEESAYAQTRED